MTVEEYERLVPPTMSRIIECYERNTPVSVHIDSLFTYFRRVHKILCTILPSFMNADDSLTGWRFHIDHLTGGSISNFHISPEFDDYERCRDACVRYLIECIYNSRPGRYSSPTVKHTPKTEPLFNDL